ncbi:MAG: CHAT domain-containing protein [bacterium]|nr:CHAT domain-containing protein [bacterium]
MQLRTRYVTDIQYFLITDPSPLVSPFLPPTSFTSGAIDFLKSSPVNLDQLANSMAFMEYAMMNRINPVYDFNVFHVGDYEKLKKTINASGQIQVFVFNCKKTDEGRIYKDLASNKSKIRFFKLQHSSSETGENNIVDEPNSLLYKLVENQDLIFEKIGIQAFPINPKIELSYKGFNNASFFTPSLSNYLLLDRMIGNFLSVESDNNLDEIKPILLQESEKAQQNPNSFERQEVFIDQIKKIDFFREVLIQNSFVEPGSAIEPMLHPLIIVSPFYNPDLKKIYEDQEIIKLIQVEQSSNYINKVSTKASEELVHASIKFTQDRIRYLDDVAFLHASFDFGPVIRLPAMGKSLNQNLSFFRADNFPKITSIKTRRKLKKMISSFGINYSKKVLGSNLKETIKTRNGQLIAITDLPIEWTMIDNVPLSFTHDICRLPETSLHGLMSLFMYNKTYEYSIPENLLEKTLVIHGTDDERFLPWISLVNSFSDEKKFHVKTCLSVSEVKDVISELNPDLIVFDCHGGYDKIKQSTFLKIGDEILDGDQVVRNNISAPLVFLSACGTAPTYGTINSIANAFFEAGAASVTTTYIPISIDSGSLLYLRLLNKLDIATRKPIHKNWLEFVSHIIRTSSINDAFKAVQTKIKEKEQREFFNQNVEALTDSLVFDKRRDLFLKLDKRIESLTKMKENTFSKVIPEYLLYSNLGRSDLIFFDSWLNIFANKPS